MHKYLFDLKLFASISVTADDEASARSKLKRVMEGAGMVLYHSEEDVPSDIILADDEEHELVEVDGKDPWDVPTTKPETQPA